MVEGNGSTGGAGYVKVEYRGTEGGETVDGLPTNPSGKYYECDTEGVPSGSAFAGNIWLSLLLMVMLKITIPNQ